MGYAQYFTGVPALLVALHVLGASLVWLAVLNVALRMQLPLERSAPDEADSAA